MPLKTRVGLGLRLGFRVRVRVTYFATIIEISKGDQRSLFQSIDHLLNRKAVPRFPLSSSDLELAESFKNFFANKIEPIRARVIAVTTPPS